MRTAASSMASGRPSRRWHRRATAARLPHGEPEAGGDGGGAVGEEGEGRVAVGGGEVAVGVGDRQRPYVQEVFLGEAEAVPAGGEDADAGGAAQQGGGEFGAGGQQVFAVVDDEEEAPVPYVCDEGVQRWPVGVVVQA